MLLKGFPLSPDFSSFLQRCIEQCMAMCVGEGGSKSTNYSSSKTQTTLHPLKTMLRENNNTGKGQNVGKERHLENIKEHTKMLAKANSAGFFFFYSFCIS